MCKSAIIQDKMPIFTFYLLWNSLWKSLIFFVDNLFYVDNSSTKNDFENFAASACTPLNPNIFII